MPGGILLNVKSKIWNHCSSFVTMILSGRNYSLRSTYGTYKIMRIYTHAWEDQFILAKPATQIFHKKKKSIHLRALLLYPPSKSLALYFLKFSIVVKFIFERCSSLLNDYCWNYKLTSISAIQKNYRVYRACSQSLALLAMYFRIIWVKKKKMVSQGYLLRDLVINSESNFINTTKWIYWQNQNSYKFILSNGFNNLKTNVQPYNLLR